MMFDHDLRLSVDLLIGQPEEENLHTNHSMLYKRVETIQNFAIGQINLKNDMVKGYYA